MAAVIDLPQRRYTLAEVAKVLADSEADLADDDGCLDVLVSHGIMPWNFSGHWIETKVEAHNIRTLRKLIQRAGVDLDTEAKAGGVESLEPSNVHRRPPRKTQNREFPTGV